MSKITPDLARKIPYNSGNPKRYNSRHFKTNSLTLTQPTEQTTPTMNMRNSTGSNGRMAIRHPAVTVRQLLPKDCALVNPEIRELDVSNRPPKITFLVLSRELTQVEKEKGVTQHPVCNARWDSPDPDIFYEVLQQVIDVLEPIHKRPGALITAASASEAVGLCIIQVRNLFGPSLDFVRRAFRGAALHDVRLETFPLDAFQPPLELHKTKPWTLGMKRYHHCITQNLFTRVPSLSPSQAKIRRERTGCHGKPAYPPPNGRHRGTVGARIKAREPGLANRTIFLNLVISLFKFVKYNLQNQSLFPNLVLLRQRRTSRASVTTLSLTRYQRLTTPGTTTASITKKKVRPRLRGSKAWQARKHHFSGITKYIPQSPITIYIWNTTLSSHKSQGTGYRGSPRYQHPGCWSDKPKRRSKAQNATATNPFPRNKGVLEVICGSTETPQQREPKVSTSSTKNSNG